MASTRGSKPRLKKPTPDLRLHEKEFMRKSCRLNLISMLRQGRCSAGDRLDCQQESIDISGVPLLLDAVLDKCFGLMSAYF